MVSLINLGWSEVGHQWSDVKMLMKHYANMHEQITKIRQQGQGWKLEEEEEEALIPWQI